MSGDEAGGAAAPDASSPADGGKDDTAAEPKEASKKGEKDAAAFGNAARNPLGAQARAAQQAYQAGRRNLRIDGPAAVIGEGRFQELQVGDRFNFYTGRGLSLAPGRVRADLLDWVRVRYVPVTGYQRMAAVLRERRLLVLRGIPNSGRSTTALHLLDEVAAGKVFRLESGADLKAVEEKDLGDGHGYLAEVRAGSQLTETRLDRLCEQLGRRGCCCVLLLENNLRHRQDLGGYTLDCPPPEHIPLLARHISREAGRDDDEGMEQRLLELSGTPQLRKALGPAPRPAETALLARLLVEHGRGRISIEDIEAGCLGSIHQQVSEWFSGLRELPRGDQADEQLRLAGFRIALAVLNESPYHIVRDFGELLAQEMMVTISPRRTPGRLLFSDDQETWLAASRAQVIPGTVDIGDATVPVSLVKFQDDRFPLAVLSHVWQRHHDVRIPLVRWLRELGRDGRALVWVRAAQAAGLLCGLDFPYTFDQLVAPEAAVDEEERRRFAAFAMDQAARDEWVGPAVEELLQYWRRNGSYAEQWTVATALGCDLGLRSVDRSLDELRIMGTRREELENPDQDAVTDLVLACSRSLAALFSRGEIRPVLSRLDLWIRSERRSLRELALFTMLILASTYGSDLLDETALTGAGERMQRPLPYERRRWPLLLALQEENHQLTEPFADLLWHTLRSPANEAMSEILGSWMHAGQRDRECLDALIGFLPHLIDDDSDARRLSYLVKRMHRNWAEPLGADTAAVLAATIDHALYQETVS